MSLFCDHDHGDIEHIHHMLHRIQEIIMANQELVDAYAARIQTAIDIIREEIVALSAQPAEQPLDTTKLQAAVDGLEGLEPPVVEPPADVVPAAE